MAEPEAEPSAPVAWQAVTPSGIAAFANAPLPRLFTVQAIACGVLMAVFIMFFVRNWVPVVAGFIEQLPPGAGIRDGALHWPEGRPPLLVENHFLSLAITPYATETGGQTADLRVTLTAGGLKTGSLFGYWTLRYPRALELALTRPELEPKWGAWRPALLAVAAGLLTAGIWVSWCLLAIIYSWPMRVMVYFRDRRTSRLGCWKLASAALLPGALLMAAAILLHSLNQLPLIGVLVAFAIHLLMGPLYAFLAAFALPLIPEAEKLRGNPFADAESQNARKSAKRNPFRKR